MTPHEGWQSIVNRQAGPFFYGVVTTRIYCSPTCPSRCPNRENVVFFDSAEEAVAAGFRPCKRYQAEDETKLRIDEICRYIRENAAESISLGALGRMAGWSPAHLQRKFKASVGVSPKQFQETIRMQLFKTTVRQSDAVTPAMYDAGFGSTWLTFNGTQTSISSSSRPQELFPNPQLLPSECRSSNESQT